MIISKIASTRNGNTYIGGLNNRTSKVSFGGNEDSWPSEESRARDAGYDSGYRAGVNSQRGEIRTLKKEIAELKASFEWLKGVKKNGVEADKLAKLLAEKDRHKTKAERATSKAATLEKRLAAIAAKLQELTALVKKK
jgi:polyhydroxyalkanoate synthesis regulator phasin